MEKDLHMTVKELIDALKQFPEDLPVVNQGAKTGFEDIFLPEKIIVRKKPENMAEYDGIYQTAGKNENDVMEVIALYRNTMRD